MCPDVGTPTYVKIITFTYDYLQVIAGEYVCSFYVLYRAVNTFHLGYKNQSVYAVRVTSRCLFSDKYKTHKYSVGRAYSC